MPPAPLPHNEPERLQEVRRYDLLDTPPEREVDDLTKIASQICDVPIALVTIVDEGRQWFKSRIGIEASETPRDQAFCAHTILHDDILVVPDAAQDRRFVANPLVTSGPRIRFYAGAPLVTPSGYALGSICVIDTKPRSLTPEQQEALRALGRQVVALFELRRTLAELRRLAEQREHFLRLASHDLRNPLTVVTLGADLLAELKPGDPLSEDMSRMAGRIQRQARIMATIIEDFLEAQAIEDGRVRLKRTPACLCGLARDVVDASQHYADRKGITLRVSCTHEPCTAELDKARITQVIQNFVSNALKFSPPKTVVAVSVGRDGDDLVLEVSDQGPGLTEDDLQRVFQKYARLSNKPTGGEKSSGLGLSIAKELIDLHGGQCGVRNNPGGGATFWFRLPQKAG